MVFGFVGELGFPVLAGGFVDVEGAFEMRLFDVEVPVAYASGGDAGDVFEFFVGFVGEVSVVAGGVEGAVPEGVGISLIEGVAGLKVGVSAEVVFKAFPGGYSIGVEEGLGFGGDGEVVAEGIPVSEWGLFCSCGVLWSWVNDFR